MVDMIEGHPIPQDITGFQFRLIGDMTIKQFAYLAVGLVLGWIFFQAPPVPFLFKVLLAAIPVLTGVIFAFVPFQGIGADTLILLFFKALIRPNQYVYNKTGKDFTNKTTAQQQTAQATVKKDAISHPAAQAVAQQPQENKITTPPPASTVIFKEHPPTTQPISPPAQTPSPIQQKPVEVNPLEKQLQDMLAQKQQLEKQLQQLQTAQQQAPAAPQQIVSTTSAETSSPSPTAQPATQSYVEKAPEQTKKTATVPFMPDDPNLIAGVIKDSRENILPNILVEVKDKDDNPVRAFKTNALGQFASATPLLNGTYTVTFEDPKKQQRFDIIELSVTGDIIPPLEITSIDEREELRKTLFTS